MTGTTANNGKDPRGGPDFAPLWTALDLTPEGRDDKWYPKLEYQWQTDLRERGLANVRNWSKSVIRGRQIGGFGI